MRPRGQEWEQKGRPRAGMGEVQRAGKGIKGKTESRNGRGPKALIGDAQRAGKGIKIKTEGGQEWERRARGRAGRGT